MLKLMEDKMTFLDETSTAEMSLADIDEALNLAKKYCGKNKSRIIVDEERGNIVPLEDPENAVINYVPDVRGPGMIVTKRTPLEERVRGPDERKLYDGAACEPTQIVIPEPEPIYGEPTEEIDTCSLQEDYGEPTEEIPTLTDPKDDYGEPTEEMEPVQEKPCELTEALQDEYGMQMSSQNDSGEPTQAILPEYGEPTEAVIPEQEIYVEPTEEIDDGDDEFILDDENPLLELLDEIDVEVEE